MTSDSGRDAIAARPSLRWGAIATVALVAEAMLLLVAIRQFTTRPYGFDEQWRATWLALGPHIATQLHEVPGPMAAGWIGLEWVTTKVLPTTELTLRLPMLASYAGLGVATFWLARRWVGDAAAYLTSALLLLNGPLLIYGVLLKPFVFEALCAVGLLLGWRWASTADRSLGARLSAYAGLGLLCVFSASALFVLVPLVVYDGFLAWRHQRLGPRLQSLWPAAVALAIAGAHFVFFLSRQDHLLREKELHPENEPYWQQFFLPHGGPGEMVGFVADRLKPVTTLLSGSFLPPDATDVYLRDTVPPSPSLLLVAPLAIVFTVLIGWGIWRAAHDESQRVLVVVLGGMLVLLLAASFQQTWPFGMVRANLTLVPLVYVLAAIGATDLLRRSLGAWKGPPSDTLARGLGVMAIVVIAMTVLVTVPVALHTLSALNERYQGAQFIDRTRDAVGLVRQLAGPDDVAVVVLNPDGWKFYAYQYDDPRFGDSQARVPGERTLLTDQFNDPAIADFVGRHPRAQRVFVFNLMGIGPADYQLQERWLRERGFCPTRRWNYPQTGILVEYERTATTGACPPTEIQPVTPIE